MPGIAKRHHWIPRFILKGFSPEPVAKNPSLVRLEKRTGRSETSSVNNEAVINQFNQVETPMTGPLASVEAGWAAIEGQCKPALDKVRAGGALTPEDLQ